MSKPKKNHRPPQRSGETGGFATQAISSPDRRDPQTHTALPSDSNVAAARRWVQENKK